jgi:hypothetical protein
MEKILRPESLSYEVVRYCSYSSTRFTHQLVCLLHVGTLETGDNRGLQVHALNNRDETLGNGIATHDTTEDVDKDGSDLGVAGDEVERLPDGLGGSTAANVQEVSGRTTVQLDDVHGGHGQTGTVDKAANVTVELDEVEANLGSLDLVSILLGLVPPLKDLLLAELGVVVKSELGVHGKDLVVGRLGQGVDFNLGGIALHEALVELLDGVLGVLNALLREADLGGNVARNLVGNTGVDGDGGRDDGLGLLLCDRLNVHATLRRGNDDGALGGAVHENGEVELAARKFAVDNVDSVAETTCGSGLLGDELVADHLVGEDGGLAGRVDDPDTALEAVVEGALSSPSGKDLGLDDSILSACARISLGGQPVVVWERIPMSLAICSASAALVATPPLGTPMPY